MSRLDLGLLLIVLLQPWNAVQALQVFACEPEWAALAEQLGGERVTVFSATTAQQDPHRIEARPSLIARLRQADLLVCTGADLEAGWLPMLLRKAANAPVQAGRPGHFLAAEHVTLKEIPVQLDRARGDVHASGNPHIQTDPRNIAQVAAALTERMQQLDATGAAYYRQRHAAFTQDWTSAMRRWEAQAAELRGVAVVVQHRSWTYLIDWLGLVEVAAVEPNPGIPPASGYLTELVAGLRERPARLIVVAAYQDASPARWLATQTGMPVVELPFTVGGSADAQDLFALFDATLARLRNALVP